MMNNLIRIFSILLALWMVTSALYNVNWEYRAVFIASMVVCLLVLWVGKRKFGLDRILNIKTYIFTGGLVVSLAIAKIVGWNDSRAISCGSLFGIVIGLIFLYSNEFWMYVTTKKKD
ncbi:hypothetical protein [Desulfosporosinus sp. I2]|uniref:hypothetical protein n=1 Tax=Desulfosporosinus sp. I2 TaxID=1617025 RepID=UPI000AF9F6EF|nr:hypothetical protein [Desulfosporosinus sp. I2]